MGKRQLTLIASLLVVSVSVVGSGSLQDRSGRGRGQQPAYIPEDHRPPLFLREDWRHVRPSDIAIAADETVSFPLSQSALTSPNVDLKIYSETRQGPNSGVMVSHRDTPKDDPVYIYMGSCFTPCAIAFRDRSRLVDLSGLAKIRWRTKQNGFHQLRPVLKLADGTWLVGDYGQGATTDWNENEFSMIDVRWRYLSIDKVVTMRSPDWVLQPDLSRVDEVGFTDLMPGNIADGGHGAAGASRVDWIEVYGKAVSRN